MRVDAESLASVRREVDRLPVNASGSSVVGLADGRFSFEIRARDDLAPAFAAKIERMLRWPLFLALILLLALVFGLLVTANSAGYRFGISDQAFYIPAIDLWRWPDLFPRDRLLLEPQARRTVIDEALGWICRATGLSLEPLFLLAYACTIATFTAGVALVGRSLFRSPWAIAGLIGGAVAAPPIPETAANTFEGYFHPRVLAFAIGLVGVGLLLHRQRALALAVSALAVAVHPTTGGWFLVWLGAAAWVMAPVRTRWIAGIAGAAMLLLTALAARDELAAGLTIMDPAWTAAFSNRDYVFPLSSWSVGTWLSLARQPGHRRGRRAVASKDR